MQAQALGFQLTKRLNQGIDDVNLKTESEKILETLKHFDENVNSLPNIAICVAFSPLAFRLSALMPC